MAEKRKITCKSFLEDMSDYLDGDIPAELRAMLEAHLAKCPDCWLVLDETRRTVEVFQTYGCRPLPEDVRGRLADALQRQWNKG